MAMLWNKNFGSLEMYTVLSNYLALIASAVYLINPERRISQLLRYTATVCLTVTFIVVIFVFIPMTILAGQLAEGVQGMLLRGNMPVHHILCPILSFISFILFEKHSSLTTRDSITAAIPTLLYAIVTGALNILNVMEGPYPFLYVYRQPWYVSVMWFLAIPSGAYLVARVVLKIQNRYSKTYN